MFMLGKPVYIADAIFLSLCKMSIYRNHKFKISLL